ncbi:MAG: hypothetical protein L0L04_07660, partial [Staphylococcus equorum]|nr:hypothetical protein [Staphylococcus equorum]
AGYDFSSAIDIIIPSIWSIKEKNSDKSLSVLVPTGIKTYMPDNEYLMLVNRSSNPLKKNIAIPNGIGIIDSDYYDNANNEGEIFVQLINYGLKDYEIKKGERIAQGIFTRYYKADSEEEKLGKRLGGFGSTGDS